MRKCIVSEKVKLRMSVAFKGWKFSQETRKLISKYNTGWKRTKDTLLKMVFNNNKRQPITLTNS